MKEKVLYSDLIIYQNKLLSYMIIPRKRLGQYTKPEVLLNTLMYHDL